MTAPSVGLQPGLDRREQGIADQLSEAERNNQEAKELLVRYEQKLADAKEEIRKMIGLFAIAPPIDPLWWFGITVTGLFTAFSYQA